MTAIDGFCGTRAFARYTPRSAVFSFRKVSRCSPAFIDPSGAVNCTTIALSPVRIAAGSGNVEPSSTVGSGADPRCEARCRIAPARRKPPARATTVCRRGQRRYPEELNRQERFPESPSSRHARDRGARRCARPAAVRRNDVRPTPRRRAASSPWPARVPDGYRFANLAP